MPRRMWEYYHAMRLRHGLPVLPIVVYLSRRTRGLRWEVYTESVFGDRCLTFRHRAIALPGFSADRFVRAASPLGAAVSALMRSGRRGRVRHKLMALSQVAKASVDDARRSLLAHAVGKYLELTAAQEAELERLIMETRATEVIEMVNIFEQRAFEKGIEKGREEGRYEGQTIGLKMGEAQGMRQSLLWLMERKFQTIPADVRARIEELTDTERLGQLIGRILDAATIEDMGIWARSVAGHDETGSAETLSPRRNGSSPASVCIHSAILSGAPTRQFRRQLHDDGWRFRRTAWPTSTPPAPRAHGD